MTIIILNIANVIVIIIMITYKSLPRQHFEGLAASD